MSDSSKSKKNNPYEKCFCYNEVVCGPFKRWNKDGIFSVVDLTADISSHFQALKVRSYEIEHVAFRKGSLGYPPIVTFIFIFVLSSCILSPGQLN